MIKVSRLDGSSLVLNADLIEFVEAIPETIVCLTTGKKIMVRETVDDVIRRVTQFRRMSRVLTQGRVVPGPADRSSRW